MRSVARTVVSTRIVPAASSGSITTSAPVTRIGWQCGRSAGVCFTPITPAIFAVCDRVALLRAGEQVSDASEVIVTTHSAVATRSVSGFAPTSTIRVTPSAPA